jgi:hypothetical protein
MNGKEYLHGTLATQLRMQLFREHLGLGASSRSPRSKTASNLNTTTTITGSSRILDQQILDCGCALTWQLFQKRALQNTHVFETVFHCAPSNTLRSFQDCFDKNATKFLDAIYENQRLNPLRGRFAWHAANLKPGVDYAPWTDINGVPLDIEKSQLDLDDYVVVKDPAFPMLSNDVEGWYYARHFNIYQEVRMLSMSTKFDHQDPGEGGTTSLKNVRRRDKFQHFMTDRLLAQVRRRKYVRASTLNHLQFPHENDDGDEEDEDDDEEEAEGKHGCSRKSSSHCASDKVSLMPQHATAILTSSDVDSTGHSISTMLRKRENKGAIPRSSWHTTWREWANAWKARNASSLQLPASLARGSASHSNNSGGEHPSNSNHRAHSSHAIVATTNRSQTLLPTATTTTAIARHYKETMNLPRISLNRYSSDVINTPPPPSSIYSPSSSSSSNPRPRHHHDYPASSWPWQLASLAPPFPLHRSISAPLSPATAAIDDPIKANRAGFPYVGQLLSPQSPSSQGRYSEQRTSRLSDAATEIQLGNVHTNAEVPETEEMKAKSQLEAIQGHVVVFPLEFLMDEQLQPRIIPRHLYI